MKHLLLLVNAEGVASAHELRVRQLREFLGNDGISVHFRPVRNDVLFHSAKVGSGVAYRLLTGEGIVRSQLWVEYEVGGPPVNVIGRSADLLFTLALMTTMWKRTAGSYPAIAATGILDADDAVAHDPALTILGVDHIEAKLGAAVDALAAEPEGVIFYPASHKARVEQWQAAVSVPPHVHFVPVTRLDDALGALGIELQRVYLGNPYRGLEYFDYIHRSVFFGREAETRELLAQLLRREAAGVPGVLVEGASGSGKSSFLRAGVLPVLANPSAHSPELESALIARPVSQSVGRAIWHPALVSAGADEGALARSIYRVWQHIKELADDDRPEVANFEELLQVRRERWPKGRLFVWLIDQLEELFTLGLDDAVVDSLGRFLLALQTDGVWSIASIRADATPTLKRSTSLRTVFGSNEGQFYLASLGPTALDDVICRPAKAAGLTFGVDSRGKRLDQTLREDAYRDHENALPVLQLTLHELYQRRSGHELTCAAYAALGGLSGAVATIASTALKQASQEPGLASRLFRSLVTVDDAGTAMRRYAPRAEIAEDPAQERLLGALVNARLCVSGQRDGQPVAALAHEAVLRTWPALVEWLKEESRLLRLRDLAERDAQLWLRQSRSDDWLASPSKLAALEPLKDAGVRLSEPVRDFIAHSRMRAHRATRLKQAGVVAAVLLAVAASASALLAVSKQHEAEREAARALQEENHATIDADTARATARFLASIFNAPTPERSLGHSITAVELLNTAARRLRTSLIVAPEVRARLTEQIGNAYREMGEYRRAAPLLESAIAEYRALANAPIDARAEADTALGQLYVETDKLPRAAQPLIRAMALEASVPAAYRSAMPNIEYAQLEMHEGDFRAAKTALDRARMIVRNRKHQPNREDYLLPLEYSLYYIKMGQPNKGIRLSLDALAAESRIFGPSDPAAVGALENIEYAYRHIDDTPLGLKYGRRALIIAKRTYGENSPIYASVLQVHAVTYWDLAEHGMKGAGTEASTLFHKVLAIRLRTLGPLNGSTGDAYYDIANLAAARGRWAESFAGVRRAQKIWEASEGRRSPNVAWALAEEARALTHLGQPVQAVLLARRSLRILRREPDPMGWYVALASQELGAAYLALGRYSQAVDALRRAVGIEERGNGSLRPLAPSLAKLLDAYARALKGAHQFTAAKAVRARAAAVRARSRRSCPTKWKWCAGSDFWFG